MTDIAEDFATVRWMLPKEGAERGDAALSRIAAKVERLQGELLEVHDKNAHLDNEVERLQAEYLNAMTLAGEERALKAHYAAEVERLQRSMVMPQEHTG